MSFKNHLLLILFSFSFYTVFAKQQAVIVSIRIIGPDEHTLVIPPDYPEYKQNFTCAVSWRVDGEPDIEKEEEEADYHISYEWSVSGCEIVGANNQESLIVNYREIDEDNAIITCAVSIQSANGYGVGTDGIQSKTVFMPVWNSGASLQSQLAGSVIDGGATRFSAPGELIEFNALLTRMDEDDKRTSAIISFPKDSVVFNNDAGGMRAIVAGSPSWTATGGSFPYGNVGTTVTYKAPQDSVGQFTIRAILDDLGRKPANEKGSNDDASFTLPEVHVIVPGLRLGSSDAIVRLNRDDDNADGQEDRMASVALKSDDDIRQCFTMECVPDNLNRGTFHLDAVDRSYIRIWNENPSGVLANVSLPSAWSASDFFNIPSRGLYVEGVKKSSTAKDIVLDFYYLTSVEDGSQVFLEQKCITVVDIWLGIDANFDGQINLTDEPLKKTTGRYILVNDDDDNDNGQQDKQEIVCDNKEDDLVPLSLVCSPAGASTVTLSAVSGGNCIKLWKSATKNDEIVLPVTFDDQHSLLPPTLYIEGVSEGNCLLRLSCDAAPVVKDEILLRVVKCNLGLDANRDGTIDVGNYATNQDGDPNKPFLFWVNDDHDCKDDKDGYSDAQDDYDTTDKDCNDNRIGNGNSGGNWCERDLEDFTVLAVQLSDVLMSDDNVTIGFEMEGAGNDVPTVNLFKYTGDNDFYMYLKDTISAKKQANESRIAALTSTCTVIAKQSFVNKNGMYPFLLEGRAEGDGRICLVLRYSNHIMAKRKTKISLHDISWFYDIYSVSIASGHRWEASVNSNASHSQTAGYQPESNSMLIYVHGWNMEEWEKKRWAETAFKRLWIQQYKGGIALFSWPTLSGFSGWWDGLFKSMHYDNSEFIAWNSSDGLLGVINQLSSSKQLTILAHSMGNIVTGEAIRKFNGNASIRYIASQAAVSAQGYDNAVAATYPARTSLGSSIETPDIYGHFFSGDSSTNPYFAPNLIKVAFYNLYNPNDYALDSWGINNIMKPDWTVNYSFKYKGSLSQYDETTDEFKLVRSIHQHGENPTYVTTFLRLASTAPIIHRYTIFSYIEESRSLPLGMCPISQGKQQRLNSSLFDGKHYAHSRQFRSFSAEMWGYWKYVLGVLNGTLNKITPFIRDGMFE